MKENTQHVVYSQTISHKDRDVRACKKIGHIAVPILSFSER